MNVEEIMTKKPMTIDQEMNVSLAMNRMSEGRIAQLPVVLKDRYVGMISYRDLVRKKSIHLNSKIRNYVVRAPELERDNSIEEALNLIRESAIGALPVVEKERVVGLVSRTDIVKNLTEFPEISKMKSFEIMNESYSVSDSDEIENILEVMRSHDTEASPVVDKEKRVVGLLRVQNILEYELKTRERVRKGDFSGEKEHVEIDIRSIMEEPVFSMEDDDLVEASNLMVTNHLHEIAICDKSHRISGILGIDDIINSLWNASSTSGMLVNVSGLGTGDSDIYAIIYSMTEKFTERFSRIANLSNGSLNIHVVKHHSEDGKIKYSVRTRLLARKVNMTVSYSGWNFGKVMSEIFDVYEKRSKKELNKD